MALLSVTCPICGAIVPNAQSAQDYICSFCKFERRTASGNRISHVSQVDTNENISEISDMTLPYIEDLNGYFQEKFQQLNRNELWYLSTPVNRIYRKNAPLSGQINFFREKNIMFLLEQHGFKMTWRQNRFSSILRIIARKC